MFQLFAAFPIPRLSTAMRYYENQNVLHSIAQLQNIQQVLQDEIHTSWVKQQPHLS